MMVRLISLTKAEGMTPEDLICYTARVSSPQNQENHASAPRLLAYLIKNQHWSPFEMVDMTVEIKTTRAIAQQILRHRSFSFQEFSQRYAAVADYEPQRARRQDTKNRQNSIDDVSKADQEWFLEAQTEVGELAVLHYREALRRGIAKEQARFLLPLSTVTTLYMKGSVRSWIHYLQLRTGHGTQAEHAEIARAIKDEIFAPTFPSIPV